MENRTKCHSIRSIHSVFKWEHDHRHHHCCGTSPGRAAKASLEVPARQDDVRTAGAEGCDDGSSHAMTRRTRCTTYRNDICGALANKKYVKKYSNMLYVYVYVYVYIHMHMCTFEFSENLIQYNVETDTDCSISVCHTHIY